MGHNEKAKIRKASKALAAFYCAEIFKKDMKTYLDTGIVLQEEHEKNKSSLLSLIREDVEKIQAGQLESTQNEASTAYYASWLLEIYEVPKSSETISGIMKNVEAHVNDKTMALYKYWIKKIKADISNRMLIYALKRDEDALQDLTKDAHALKEFKAEVSRMLRR
ncbi:hypothetical protein M1373_00360 [Candidatus Marsarchaeota archaeon]|nr:hypothetical protein [Candidatus Marsarchaeota archaeon]MCL5404482.1 hypothetical protein [Candidatus Marsarchaeota archaeon]